MHKWSRMRENSNSLFSSRSMHTKNFNIIICANNTHVQIFCNECTQYEWACKAHIPLG